MNYECMKDWENMVT